MRSQRRSRRRWWRAASFWLLGAAALGGAPTAAQAQQEPGPTEVPFTPAFEGVLAGDLVMAGNSNVLAAGGWPVLATSKADVDGDVTLLCVGRRYVPAACADNSSSATLDVPPGARIVQARLYVNTTLSSAVGPVRVRLDGPGGGYAYTELTAVDPQIPKLYEGAGGGRSTPVLRQAVWDVTSYVAAGGPGAYTVADIVHERAAAWLPYASWTIVAAYERDPTVDSAMETPEQQQRFARRAVSWHDGFVVRTEGSLDVPVEGVEVAVGDAVFAKSFHVVAHAQARRADNLLFNGGPLGNNLTPGDGPAPAGVTIGADPACNSTTDIFNDSICVLGVPVETKVPGPLDFRASGNGSTPTSGSAVDMDVIRIPDRYVRSGSTPARFSLRTVANAPLAAGLLAVTVDLPAVDAAAVAPVGGGPTGVAP